jgi:hypothetical protein
VSVQRVYQAIKVIEWGDIRGVRIMKTASLVVQQAIDWLDLLHAYCGQSDQRAMGKGVQYY